MPPGPRRGTPVSPNQILDLTETFLYAPIDKVGPIVDQNAEYAPGPAAGSTARRVCKPESQGIAPGQPPHECQPAYKEIDKHPFSLAHCIDQTHSYSPVNLQFHLWRVCTAVTAQTGETRISDIISWDCRMLRKARVSIVAEPGHASTIQARSTQNTPKQHHTNDHSLCTSCATSSTKPSNCRFKLFLHLLPASLE